MHILHSNAECMVEKKKYVIVFTVEWWIGCLNKTFPEVGEKGETGGGGGGGGHVKHVQIMHQNFVYMCVLMCIALTLYSLL